MDPLYTEYHKYINSPQPMIHMVAVCNTCKIKHEIKASALTWLNRIDEWNVKHPQPLHDTEFISTKRIIPPKIDEKAFIESNTAPWWLEYKENADVKMAYASSANYTCGLATTPLASSTTLIAGRESTAVSNTSNLYLDYLVGGQVTTGTSPTAGRIEVSVYGSINDTPLYPDVLDGTDSDEAFDDVDERNACVIYFAGMVTTTASNRNYFYGPKGLNAFFGGLVPKNHGLWISHNTVAALNSTGSNHIQSMTGVYITSI